MPVRSYKSRYNPGKTPRRRSGRRPRRFGRLRRRSAAVASMLGIEKKYLDTYASVLTVPLPTDASGGEMQPEGGCTNCLSAPAQGDGEQQRDGRKIELKSCFLTGTLQQTVLQDQGDVTEAAICFLALVLDTQANGATVVSEQVFTNPNDTSRVNNHPLRNLQYSSRYRVLASKTINTAPVTAGTDGANTLSVKGCPRAFKLGWNGNIPVTFTGSTADVASVADNALHLIAYTTIGVVTLNYNCRVRFVG